MPGQKVPSSIYNYQNYETTASFERDIYEGNIILIEAKYKQSKAF